MNSQYFFRFSTPVILIVCLSLFYSCSPDKKDDKETIRIRIQDEPDCLNPIISQSSLATQIENQIMPPLFEYDGEDLEIKPILIKELSSQKIVNDSTVAYDYQFLDEAAWEDGSKLTVKDLEFTIKAALNPYLKNKTWRNTLKNIINVESSDPSGNSFTISINKNYFLAREMSGNYNLYPEYIYDQNKTLRHFNILDLLNKDSAQFTIEEHQLLKSFADEFQNADHCSKLISGAGAYKLLSWEKGSKLILERKSNWWGDKLKSPNTLQTAFAKKIEYQVIPDDVAAIAALKNGSLDLSTLSPKQFVTLKKENLPSLLFATPTIMQYYYIEINNTKPGLSEKAVRLAMAHALDQDNFIKNQMEGLATRIVGPVHPSKTFYNKSLQPYTYDINLAKKLLSDASWKDTDKDGILDKIVAGKKIKLAFQILVSGKDLGRNMALHLQEECKKIGIAIEIISKEGTIFQKDLQERNFDLATSVTRQSPSLWDPFQSWHSSNIQASKTNRCGFATPETDSLIQIIRTAESEPIRNQAYLKFQEILHENEPQIFLFSPTERIVYSSKLKFNPTAKRPGYTENNMQKID